MVEASMLDGVWMPKEAIEVRGNGAITAPAQRLQPNNGASITFGLQGAEAIRFDKDGSVFVRGEKVDNNAKIYQEFVAWFEQAKREESRAAKLADDLGALKSAMASQVDDRNNRILHNRDLESSLRVARQRVKTLEDQIRTLGAKPR